MKFSVRDLLWLTAVLALLIIGLTERARLVNNYEWILRDEHEKRVKAEGSRLEAKKFADEFRGFDLHKNFGETSQSESKLPNSSAPAPNPPKP